MWTTASLFFQVTLLGGYLYAHLVARWRPRAQLALHALLVAAALGALPVAAGTIDFAKESPVVSLMAVLTVSVGLPAFALSATAPLLQHWFSRSGHRAAADPYFLYSASNAGSLLALLAYPLVLEPLLGLRQQTLTWSFTCGLFAVLVFACGASLWKGRSRERAESNVAAASPSATAPLTWTMRLRWLLLAMAPSSLMLGVTQHITSEIAAAPLLWLIPLTIYVLTFILAFARTERLPARWVNRTQPLLTILLILVWPLNNFASVLLLHLVVFAVTAMMCHAELARTRPGVDHLTSFYLYVAIGGAAGGAFNALVAPVVFDSVLEYPIALALACALRPHEAARAARSRDVLPPIALAVIFAALVATGLRPFTHAWSAIVYLQAIGLALYVTARRPLAFALSALVVIVATPLVHSPEQLLERHRSFFGVHSVLRDESNQFNVLMHGITIHGAQHIDPEKRTKPTTYFHLDSPIGHVFSVLGRGDKMTQVAIVGMGTGTLACHRSPGREWTFYEIDPLVVSIARDERYFRFLSDCAPHARIEVGDGRLNLSRAPEGAFDLLVIDTFSSDAIPAHMLTREALALYLSRVREGGVIAFHITNQYLDLVPVLARLAADAKVAAYMPGPRFDLQLEERLAALPSSWIVVSRDARRLEPLATEEGWKSVPAPAAGRIWTDDYSNVLGALK